MLVVFPPQERLVTQTGDLGRGQLSAKERPEGPHLDGMYDGFIGITAASGSSPLNTAWRLWAITSVMSH